MITYNQVTEKLNEKISNKITVANYEDWLEGGATYDKFDNAVKEFLGEELYDVADDLARLDATLRQALFPDFVVNGGGVDLKTLIKEY